MVTESIAMKAAHKFCERFGEWKQQEVVECELAAIIEAEYGNVEAVAEARGIAVGQKRENTRIASALDALVGDDLSLKNKIEEMKLEQEEHETRLRQVLEAAILKLSPDPSHSLRLVEAERERIVSVIKQHEQQASMNETEFDAIGETCLVPDVRFWEGRRVACQELLAAIDDKKE